MIGKMAEQPAANRPDDEAKGKQNGRVQLLNDRISARKKRIREVEGKRGVSVEVVPLDEIANRAHEDRAQSTADIGEVERFVGGLRTGGEGAGRFHGLNATSTSGLPSGLCRFSRHMVGADDEALGCAADV